MTQRVIVGVNHFQCFAGTFNFPGSITHIVSVLIHEKWPSSLAVVWPVPRVDHVTFGRKKTLCGAISQRVSSALGRTRTCDPLVRNQVLYPLSYEGKLAGFMANVMGDWRGGRDSNPRSSFTPTTT